MIPLPLVLLVLASHGHSHHHRSSKSSKSELGRALKGLDGEVQGCLPDGASGGTLKARWEITTTGEATEVFVDREDSGLDEDVADCAQDKIQGYRFPNQDHDRKVSHTFHLGHAPPQRHHRSP